MKSLFVLLLIVLLSSSIILSNDIIKQGEENPGEHKVSSDLTPIIFVPGIMGSPLYDDVNNDNHLTFDEKAWFGIKFPSMWLKANGCDPAGNYNIKVAPLRNDPSNTLKDELNIKPMDVYKNFFSNLEANGYTLDNYDSNHSEGENLFCFTYDWRKDNAINAKLLSDFIDSVKEWTGASKVNLIGHSMGGIVSKICISIYDKQRIEKMIFIGTPHLGAPEMLTVLLTGKLFDWVDFIIADYSVKSLGRNLPACYQLLPSANYFNLNIKNNVSSGIENYSNCFQLPDGYYASYSEMNDYLKKYSSSLNETLNSSLIDSAEIFEESIDNIDFGDIQVFNIVGCNLPTIGQNRIKISKPFNLISIESERTLNGDQTVPLRSAEIINDQVFQNTYYIPNVIHSDLPSSLETLKILLGILKNPAETDFPEYLSPPESYAAPVTSVTDVEIPNHYFISQNYPNPFNPTTRIRYSIPNNSFVTLKIFDVLGKEITTLVNEEKIAGEYYIIFDAGNLPAGRQGLPSGVYYYQFRAGDYVNTKKLILMK